MTAAVILLATLGVWALNWGCADPRKEPLAPAEPGYTETIALWNDVPLAPDGEVSATFNVNQELAQSSAPDFSPARLRVAVYIAPDCQIYRRQQIILDSIPYVRDSVITGLLLSLGEIKNEVIGSDTVKKVILDTLERRMRTTIDSLRGTVQPYQTGNFSWRGHDLTCDASRPFAHVVPDTASPHPDTTGLDSTLMALDPQLAALELQLFRARIDTALLGFERDFLAASLDAYYVLSVSLDSTNAFFIPNAVYVDSAGNVEGQQIYAAAVDSATGLIGRGFLLDLGKILAADITHIGRTFEVNWAVCFSGSNRACLSPGLHTLYVRMPGAQSRVTGAIVLVYAERV